MLTKIIRPIITRRGQRWHTTEGVKNARESLRALLDSETGKLEADLSKENMGEVQQKFLQKFRFLLKRDGADVNLLRHQPHQIITLRYSTLVPLDPLDDDDVEFRDEYYDDDTRLFSRFSLAAPEAQNANQN